VVTHVASKLREASGAAFKAADNAASFVAKAKHLPSAGGNYAKFAQGTNPNALLREALASPNAQFMVNPSNNNAFRVVTDFAPRVVGTRGETSIRAVVDYEGNVWSWFPVR
jgi:hypothetical protein